MSIMPDVGKKMKPFCRSTKAHEGKIDGSRAHAGVALLCCIFLACGRVEAPEDSEPLDRASGDGSQDAVSADRASEAARESEGGADAGPTALIEASSDTAADIANGEAPTSDASAGDALTSDVVGEEILGDARIFEWGALGAGPAD